MPSPVSNETSLVIQLKGDSHTCNKAQGHDAPNTIIEELVMGDTEGHYRMAYSPSLAGLYQSLVMMRSQGGLLATYFKNKDFSQPVYKNNAHISPPYHIMTPLGAAKTNLLVTLLFWTSKSHLIGDLSLLQRWIPPFQWIPSLFYDRIDARRSGRRLHFYCAFEWWCSTYW